MVSQLSDGFQPLYAVYSQNCLSPIKRLLIADKLKITGFYKEMRLLGIPEEKIKPFNKDGRLFLNINTPEDLKHIDKKIFYKFLIMYWYWLHPFFIFTVVKPLICKTTTMNKGRIFRPMKKLLIGLIQLSKSWSMTAKVRMMNFSLLSI